MDGENKHPLDYYLLPTAHFKTHKIRLADSNALEFDAFRRDSLGEFFSFTERVQIRDAA